MNINNAFKAITLVVGSFMQGIWLCFLVIGNDIVAPYFWISLFFFLLFILAYNNVITLPESKKVLEEMEKNRLAFQEKKQKYQDEEVMMLEKINRDMQIYIDKYGVLTKDIKLLSFSYPQYKKEEIENKIMIFESSSKIIILGNEFSFSDILAFELKDDEKTIYQSAVSTTTSSVSNASMLGRAVIGGVLFGGVGAIIGGTTGKKDIITTTSPQEESVIHHYKIHIIVNSFSNAQIIVDLNNDNIIANEIFAVLSVILERNKTLRK